MQTSTISELEYERNRYYKLMDNIKTICVHLNNSKEHITKAAENLDKYYRLGDMQADDCKLNEDINNITNIYNILISKIIPTINNRINQLNIDISSLQNLTNGNSEQ